MRCTMLLALAVSVLFGAGCTVTYPEGVLACTVPDDCPPGWSCRSDLRCHSTAGLDAAAPEDATIDASLVDGGPPDAPPIDLGCPATGPTNATCPWYFGRPHAVPSLQPGASVFSAAVLGNGLSLYVAGYGGSPDAPVYEASRADASVPFGPLRPTLGAQTPGVGIALVSITADGLEMFAQASDTRSAPMVARILRYSRTSTARPFDPPETIPAVEALGASKHPSITADGLELFFVNVESTGARVVYSTRRTARDQSFEVAQPAGLPVGLEYSRVAPDGLGIFGGAPAQYATRTDRNSAFGAPSALPNASPEMADFAFPTYVPETRELWYTSGLAGPSVPWTATPYALWRVRVCRDGPCPAEPRAELCPPGSPQSADGFHCYFPAAGVPMIWANGTDACGAGVHLASIHSAEELLAVQAAALGDPAWLGLRRLGFPDNVFRWTTDEPLIWSVWNGGMPDPPTTTSECVALISGVFDDIGCTSMYTPVCEQSIWPTW